VRQALKRVGGWGEVRPPEVRRNCYNGFSPRKGRKEGGRDITRGSLWNERLWGGEGTSKGKTTREGEGFAKALIKVLTKQLSWAGKFGSPNFAEKREMCKSNINELTRNRKTRTFPWWIQVEPCRSLGAGEKLPSRHLDEQGEDQCRVRTAGLKPCY